jgi:hypothetical protein
MMTEVQRQKTNEYVVPWDGDTAYWDPYYTYSMMYPTASPDAAPFVFQADNGAPLPPRKKFLDMFMGQIDKLVSMMSSDIAQITLSPEQQAGSKVQMQILADTLGHLGDGRDELKGLTKVDKPDTEAIFKTAKEMRDNTSGINDLCKGLAKSLRQ